MFQLAHLSDIHLAPMGRARLSQLLNKRIIGHTNWHRMGRKRAHQRDILDALVADLVARTPNHTAVTGDLINLALPDEFEAAGTWLKTLGQPEDVTVVPGNHDTYVEVPYDEGMAQWEPYFQPNEPGKAHAGTPEKFPFVRIVGETALIGVTTGVPTIPFSAVGEMGSKQRTALARVLEQLDDSPLCKVLLIHHPPLPGLAGFARDLRDAQQLTTILARHQIDLALHGHNHTSTLAWGVGPKRRFPVVGVPSASLGKPDDPPHARYNIYDIARPEAQTGWQITMNGYGVRPGETGIHHLEKVVLDPVGNTWRPVHQVEKSIQTAPGGLESR